MMFASDGSRYLGRRERFVMRMMASLRRRLHVVVEVGDRVHQTRYVCETAMDAQRPLSLWIKEAGTMAWIEAEVRPGDVLVYGSRVDHLVETGVIRAPTLVKIDVDGNELAILRGMTGLLRGRQRPRAVQVELNAGEHDAITASCRPDAGRRRSGRSGLHAMHRVDAYGRVVGRTGFVPSTTCGEQVLNVRCEATGTRSRRGCSPSR